jgi:hypothetical protein
MVVWSAAGHLTSDGSLSGIMAVHLRDGVDHLVFVPNSGYSGSLKAHVTVALSLFADMPRAFALASVLFFVSFVAGVYRLGQLTDGRSGLPAGLFVALAPPWVTHYSLSNDGNYVEVLALGTWALALSVQWILFEEQRRPRAAAIGILLGLALWCHVLAAMHVATVGIALLVFGRRRGLAALPRLVLGLALGYLPGILWNAQNDWFSLGYLAAGAHQDRPVDPLGFPSRIPPMVTDHWPILMGYRGGPPTGMAALGLGLAWGGILLVLLAVAAALRRVVRKPRSADSVLLAFAGVNVALVLLGSEHIPGNPRYLLFLMAPIPVLLASASESRPWRLALGVLVAFGTLGSLADQPAALRTDDRWRTFVTALESEPVRFCHTDFYIAAKINFLSEERIVCSSRLGPTYADYFRFRERVDRAAEADLIPINRTRAARIESRLRALGVAYERVDLMKPVLLRLSRKIDPEELRGRPQGTSSRSRR